MGSDRPLHIPHILSLRLFLEHKNNETQVYYAGGYDPPPASMSPWLLSALNLFFMYSVESIKTDTGKY